jgi:hypothetical protein
MNSGHSFTDEYDNDQLSFITQILTENICRIEHFVGQAIINNKEITNAKKNKYFDEITRLLNLICAIVSHCPVLIRVNTNSLSNEIRQLSENEIYNNVLANLTMIIQQDIIMQQSIDMNLIAAERWIYILKLAYEQGNRTIASCIINAFLVINKPKHGILKKVSTIAEESFKNISQKIQCVLPENELIGNEINKNAITDNLMEFNYFHLLAKNPQIKTFNVQLNDSASKIKRDSMLNIFYKSKNKSPSGSPEKKGSIIISRSSSNNRSSPNPDKSSFRNRSSSISTFFNKDNNTENNTENNKENEIKSVQKF